MAVLLGGCNPSSHEGGGTVFSSTQAEAKVAELRSELESHPNDPKPHVELGKTLLSEKCFDAARQEFEEVLIIDSKHLQAHLLLALVLQKQPKPDLTRATELLEKAVRIAPDNAQAHLNLAQVYDKQHRSGESTDEFRKAIELSNDPAILVSSHLGLMALYKRQGDVDRADEEYEAACRIDPKVKDMIVQAQINRSTPPPQYPGDPRNDGRGLHPSLETRMKRAREVISEVNGEQK